MSKETKEKHDYCGNCKLYTPVSELSKFKIGNKYICNKCLEGKDKTGVHRLKKWFHVSH
jgi:hypothetical protein